jgi:nucleoside phosphorylase
MRRMGGLYQFRHARLQDRLVGRPATDDGGGTGPLWSPEDDQVGDDRNPADSALLPPAVYPPGERLVVVLTALEIEHEAVRKHLVDLRLAVHPAGTLFEVGRISGSSRWIALAVLGEGNQTAAVITDRSAGLFHPEFILFVGVAGALSDDICLGDVVVATRIYSYQSGRETDDGFLARPRAWEAPHHLEQRARYLSRTGSWTALLPERPDPPAAVHFKPIAAGEVVLAAIDSSLATFIRRHYNDAAAVEMEGAGVARAAHLNRALPVLVIRGISDRANAGKQELDRSGWQQVAAANVAAFALGLITSLPVEE